jgi:mannose-1-phosphate guanylyltransferase
MTSSIKSAILLVGGMGTRMQPLTFSTPKPMLKVLGIPFTEHQIVKAREAGITEIVLATSFMAEIFEPYFGNGENFGIKISYAVEETALGTGGAIQNAAKKLEGSGPVVIFNGDVLSSHNLEEQMAFHLKNQADVTLYLTEVPDARAFGVVELDDSHQILSFNEKMENPPTNMINAGCYIFNREVIESIPDGRVVSVERETFPELLKNRRRLLGFVDRNYWLDIGNPRAFLTATRDLISGRASSPALSLAVESGRVIKQNDEVATGSHVEIIEPSTQDSGCFIDNNVVIGSQSHLTNCIIGEGAHIGEKAVLINTFVAPGFHVPAATLAENMFFGFGTSSA